MPLIYCRECGAQISSEARFCVSCGAKSNSGRDSKPKKKSNRGLAIVLLTSLAGVAMCNSGNSPSSPTVTDAPQTIPASSPTVAPLSQASEKPLDYSKPIYTGDRTVICPIRLLASPVDSSAKLHDAFSSLFHQEEARKELGCEVWRRGIRVYVRPRAKDDFYVGIGTSPDQIGLLFTVPFELTNVDEKPDKQVAAAVKAASSGLASPHTGIAYPDLINSPDTTCDSHDRQCSDEEFLEIKTHWEAIWYKMPESDRLACVAMNTFPALYRCITNRELVWFSQHPNEPTASLPDWIKAEASASDTR